MKIHRFETITGNFIADLQGQRRFGYRVEGLDAPYDIEVYEELKRPFSSRLLIYDYENQKIYEPFDEDEYMVIADVYFQDDTIYILKVDWLGKKLFLYDYHPEREIKVIWERELLDIHRYNLKLIGPKIHILSWDESVKIYYPMELEYLPEENETVVAIDDYIYSNCWHEEGFDEENNLAGIEYRYYDELIIRDLKGNIVERKLGCLYLKDDGKYYSS
ncbi:MAG: hypothetical protein Q4P28_03935 [Tissierellia bacterium]|nr:hypothetical protein [Tissierellia bacterium]